MSAHVEPSFESEKNRLNDTNRRGDTNNETKLLVNSVRKFLKTHLAPISDQYNQEERFPDEVFRKFFQAGFGTSYLPEEWGGTGSLGQYLLIAEEMGKVDGGFALSVLVSGVLFGNNIFLNGSDDQRRKYLPPITDGSKIGCWALTEPSCGSDALAIRTTAEKTSSGYTLNGSKTFISNAPIADYYIVLTRLKGMEGKGIEGGCAFILEKGTPGLSVGKPFSKMGNRTSPTGEIFLENVRVPESARMGKEGKGFYDMKRSLDFERLVFCSIGFGAIDESLRILIRYAAQRVQFGKPILEYQFTQDKIAEVVTHLEPLRVYNLALQEKFLRNEPIKKEAAILKLSLSQLAVKATDYAIQVLGGYGYMTEYKVERFHRDAKLFEIGGGTSEIQKLIIAKETINQVLSAE